ncbi:MAG: 2-oxo acid dehydrogenase subunit E2 [Alphaproteobacteria bacterium]|jgi:pyruvate/2-oxoglutarate dehydrogenase complex dihydrolipoamide acyltransferase (E2) component|nr:2-oxo acid dehydrogenase subunit E2 [Alphaproteobacteria bacterium]MBT4082589.1 2-oxo acid dehydrogenase subunit E2 [Alphaproteobacteria bacterium]MBT4545851.1 2-oxo acid dehydrogenase subunit E2 [Alphaproteobacteria bacterium]MBT7747841.1 2-oxo acid dehydrogenase subunit E2 [Alphaproteobacteria bacterium]
MYEFILPDIGEGISEALLINWTVNPGDQVAEDQEVATISTDKVDVELPSPRAGTVSELCWKPGDTVQVGSVFMRIETADDSAETPTPAKVKKPKPKAATPEKVEKKPGNIIAAPSTRKLAAEQNIDLSSVSGSGPEGRVLRRDIATTTETKSEAPSGVRIAMAERMAHSVHTLAHTTMNFEVHADGLLALQKRLSPAANAQDLKLSMSVIIAKCVATALTRHPRFNATIDEEAVGLVLHNAVNMGLALASDRGLTVPVLRDVQALTLFALARHLGDTVNKGRDNQLQPADFRDGTFTLTNTGGLETADFLSTRPVINAPQAAILWVSRIKTRPRVVNEQLEAGPVINCSLSFDHRFLDGAEGVAFINDIAELFEIPEQALASE